MDFLKTIKKSLSKLKKWSRQLEDAGRPRRRNRKKKLKRVKKKGALKSQQKTKRKKIKLKKKSRLSSQKKKVVKKASKTKKKKKITRLRKKTKDLPLGYVTHYFPKARAAAIFINGGKLVVGDEVLIKGPKTEVKQKIKSMQIDREPIQEANRGEEIGIRTSKEVRQGDQVFKLP